MSAGVTLGSRVVCVTWVFIRMCLLGFESVRFFDLLRGSFFTDTKHTIQIFCISVGKQDQDKKERPAHTSYQLIKQIHVVDK